MAFRGFPAEALEFYEGLEADNSKAYWQEHKEQYERAVKGPMDALLAELADEFGPGKVFRPYRDVRFSADKTPYKTHIGATVERGGYVQFGADGLAAGCGYYIMAKDQLERYRAAVAGPAGEEFERVIASTKKAGIDVQGYGTLKTAPRGYPKDHPRIDLLRHKGVVTWRQWPVAPWLGTKAAAGKVADFFRASKPLTNWLDDHVGPTELVYEGR